MRSHFPFQKIFFVITCLFFQMTQAQNIYQKEIDLLHIQNNKLQELRQSSAQLQKQLNNMGKEIRTLKTTQGDDFFQNTTLQKKMQAAQKTSIDLKKLYKQQANLQETITFQKNSLLKKIEKTLAQSHLNREADNQSLMKTYVQLQELPPLPMANTKTTPPIEFSLSTQGPLDQEETKEQIVVLQDLQVHLQELIKTIHKEASLERQKMALSKELSFLINEEQFFGEQGFIQGRARKRELEASAESSNSDPDNPIDDSGSTTDPVDPENPIDPEPPIDEPIDPGVNPDINLEPEIEPDIAPIDQNFEVIDPKFQTQMVEDILIYSPTDERSTGNNTDTTNASHELLITNPQLISKNVEKMEKLPNESQTHFRDRKLSYLQNMLQTLKNQTIFLQKKLEAQ